MRVVLALGGNALLRRGESPEAETQWRHIERAVQNSVAPIAKRHEVAVTHGNGPQIGFLAQQSSACHAVHPYPLDVLGAESGGLIGYMIELALANALPTRDVATLLTQVEVDPGDPAFANPSKPIGPMYSDSEAKRIARKAGWRMVQDGERWRRAVPSPEPVRIRAIGAIRLLMRAGVIVVCTGGGGIPVIPTASGGLKGVEAVIDKDLAAALLAEAIEADRMLLLTDVPAAWSCWPKERGEPIHRATPEMLRGYDFAAGSMGPKVAAACRFVHRTGGMAAIGALDEAEALLAGRAGTVIRPS